MSDSFRHDFANELASLPSLTDALNLFLNRQRLAPEVIFRVNLAVEEIVTNIIKYGYDDAIRHTISLRISPFPDHIRLQLQDDGHPFDPVHTPKPDINAPLEQRRIGGLGLHLVREMTSRIDYRRENGRNVLEIDIARNSD